MKEINTQRWQKLAGLINETEDQHNAQIYGKLLYELLSEYNEFIGSYNEDVDEVCDGALNKISDNKWYSVSDVINLDTENKNIILGGVLVYAFSMDAENNIDNNYFAYKLNNVKPSEDGKIYGISSNKIEYYQNLLSYIGRGFFHDISRQIDASPEEWYEILGDEAFNNIAGVINTNDVDYSQSDIANLKNNSQKYSAVSPSHMGDELEVELASLKSK